MDFIILFGPQAVGKMTVGEELEKQTGLKLFHNHMTIDLVLKLFPWEEGIDLIFKFREDIMEKMAKSKQKGMIFTYVWAFDLEKDNEYIEHISNIFKDANKYYVELVADLDTRLKRNKTENRLSKKWTKKDIKSNEFRMKETVKKYRTTSNDGEIQYDNYLKIDNTHLSAEEVAEMIMTEFDLEKID